MADAVDIYGTAFKNGAITLLARIVDENDDNVLRAGVASIAYTVYLLDDQDANKRTAVNGHSDVAVMVSSAIYDTLQTADVWTVDATGYNFRHTLDVASHPAFAIAGRRYLIEYRLRPATGQIILVRFRINVI